MKKIVGFLLIGLAVSVLAGSSSAAGIDLYSLFPNLTLGSDPDSTDYCYVAVAGITANTLTLQLHVVTDNSNSADYLQGIDVALDLTADQAGATLDTTVATVFGGSAVSGWGIQSAHVYTSGGNPSSFPLSIELGAVELDTADAGAPLGPGDYVFATLKFNLTSPVCPICTEGGCFDGCPAMLVTTVANGYTVQVTPSCPQCGIPTLSEWGLILFGVVLFGSLVWYLRRRRWAAAG